MGVSRLQTMLAVSLIVGCAPYETQTVQNNPRPDPSRQAQAQHEQKPGDLTGEAKVSGNSVNVLVQKTMLCRDVTTTPMVADTTSEKNLTTTGRGTQYLLAGGAVVLAGAGAYMIGGPCKKTDTDAAGKDVERDCTSQEKKDQTNGGVGLIVVGGAAGAMFVVNLFRTQDSQEVKSTRPLRTETPWKQCETAAARDTTVTLMLPGAALTAVTDGDGIARFDLSNQKAPSGVDDQAILPVTVDSKQVANVDLSRLDVFPEWKEQLRAARAAREAREQEEEEKEKAEIAARKEKLAALDKQCSEGDGAACYSIAIDIFVWDESRQLSYMKRACELNHESACSEHKKMLAERKRERAEAARRRKAAAARTKRSLQKPEDVQALQLESQKLVQCDMACAREVQTCINRAPSYNKAQYVEKECKPPYQTCQYKCEAALNKEGFCVEKNILTGKSTGAVGPCP